MGFGIGEFWVELNEEFVNWGFGIGEFWVELNEGFGNWELRIWDWGVWG